MCRVVVSLFSSRQSPALGLFPNLNKPPVQAALGNQFLMSTPLDNTAILYHQNLIGVLDGSQPVGDGEDCFPLCQSGQSLLDQVFILRVYAGGRFIKDDDRGVLQNGPGDGDALLLSSGEGRAAFSNHGVIAVRQGRDEVMAARSFCGSYYLLMGGIGAAEFDIVLHTVLEEIHILKDHGDISQQAFAGKFFHIVATHRNGAAVRVIEAGHQIAYRALAGAGRPHNGSSGPLGRGKG